MTEPQNIINIPVPSLDENTFLTVEDVAAACHEANAALCRSQGDASQPTWANAEPWQRQSAINGVLLHQRNHLAGVPTPPSASHESWMAEKVATGWTWGPEKRPDLKEHPCMVPYEQLPQKQQAKDALFGNVCAALLPYTFSEDIFAVGPEPTGEG